MQVSTQHEKLQDNLELSEKSLKINMYCRSSKDNEGSVCGDVLSSVSHLKKRPPCSIDGQRGRNFAGYWQQDDQDSNDHIAWSV